VHLANPSPSWLHCTQDSWRSVVEVGW
jgi:hypothetical protein